MNTLIPDSLGQLLELLAENIPGTELLAGGTDFNVQCRKGVLNPNRVLCIGHLDELKGIRLDGEHLRLGALTTFAEVVANELLQGHVPDFCRALAHFASPPVRNLATLGGNIANASPTADSVPPLLVRLASLELRSVRGVRQLPLNEFFTGYKRTAMAQDELITAVLLPVNAEDGLHSYWRKVGTRRALTIAKLSLAGMGRIENGQLSECRLAAGALNEYPRRLTAVEQHALTTPLAAITRESLNEALRRDITPIDDLRSDADYRFETCLNLLQTCLRDWSDHA
ncbi:MAG: xanthine dehydrogenase family protein subunit M [Candidatus Cloacimonetes bacterium]|nr:xanthine dehydrogenase family protein subunit M [Candidatus Cloacimonadota bacterium]